MFIVCKKKRNQVVHLYPKKSSGRARNVTLEIYPAVGATTAAIVCPGGSYCWLAYRSEGVDVAKFLQKNGISAFVLRYRVASWWAWFSHYRLLIRGNQAPDMYNDAQSALRWVKNNSHKYGIDSNKIGIIGFSAGGHLAMSQVLFPDGIFPSFIASIYPVVTLTNECTHKRSRRGLLGDRMANNPDAQSRWSVEQHIPQNCPPVFLVNCVDDHTVDYHNSILLDSALTAAGINHKYIQYATGGHGFGVSDDKGSPESRQWKYQFIDWLHTLEIHNNC
ncbi:MAG: alpha/beta hydrolase [Bacteroidales bacterium]|nr:alpha/beta hydrolase [Candidatus Colimorpha onthohippi]